MARASARKQVPFRWEGTDRTGRPVRGRTVAINAAAVRRELRRQGVAPTRVRKSGPLLGMTRRIATGDIAMFSRQLATMMNAGIPLVQAFDIIGAGHDNPSMQKLVLAIRTDIEGGTALADALTRHPAHFDDLYVKLVAAGERAGALDTLLEKIASYKEKSEAIRKKVQRALFYPAAVVAVAVVVTAILLIYVIPEFESLFEGFGAALPAFTRFVIDISEFVRDTGWSIALAGSLAVAAYLRARRRHRGVRRFTDRLSLRLPVIGSILTRAAIARYARTLATTFAAGVPLVEALESVAGATGNSVYETAVLALRDDVAAGQRLQQAMYNTDLFPNLVIQMVAVGEESGSLDAMAAKVADFYEAEVEHAVDGMSTLIEPLVMAVLGVLVGGLVVAMYLPIFRMGAVI